MSDADLDEQEAAAVADDPALDAASPDAGGNPAREPATAEPAQAEDEPASDREGAGDAAPQPADEGADAASDEDPEQSADRRVVPQLPSPYYERIGLCPIPSRCAGR